MLDPPERLLCGPGPTNVDPAVLDAMRKPMLGHLDPDLHEILLDVVGMLRRTWRMQDGLVLPLHCTGTAGMEAGIANLVEPGDTVVVGVCGYFGRRIAEIARRYGAVVVEVRGGLGRVDPQRSDCSRSSTIIPRHGCWRSCTPRPRRGSSTRSPTWPRRWPAAARC